METNRRDFIKKTALSTIAFPFVNLPHDWATINTENQDKLSINIFSKHLQFLDHKTTGQMAAELGFSGVDLTVRPNGHVLPEFVKTGLPKAINAIKAGGSECNMITTSIDSVNNPLDVDTIKSAAHAGIKYYRTHWFKYHQDKSIQESLEIYKKQVKELAKLNEEVGIVGYYQNYEGTDIGSSFWEIKMLLENIDPKYFGTQYDIRHAMAEGGYSWENGLELLQSHIKVIVLKDFKWGKVNGKWEAVNTPIGEGMVDFYKYFKKLKKYKLKPPVSLHLEYPLGGAEKGKSTITVDKKVVFDAMKKDLKAISKLWNDA